MPHTPDSHLISRTQGVRETNSVKLCSDLHSRSQHVSEHVHAHDNFKHPFSSGEIRLYPATQQTEAGGSQFKTSLGNLDLLVNRFFV